MTRDTKISTVLVIASFVVTPWFFWTPVKLAYLENVGDGVEGTSASRRNLMTAKPKPCRWERNIAITRRSSPLKIADQRMVSGTLRAGMSL
jgi:hypothetical protein